MRPCEKNLNLICEECDFLDLGEWRKGKEVCTFYEEAEG